MTRTFGTISTATLLLVASSLPLLAQDQFGSSVAISDADVLVMKPGTASGPATVYAFRRADDGSWELGGRVRAAQATEAGERFSTSMALAADELLVAGADAANAVGAFAFQRAASGDWTETEAIRLIEESADEGPAETQTTLATVFRILSPPRRVVARDGDRVAVAVVGSGGAANFAGTGNAASVRILWRDSDGSWSEEARLDPEAVEDDAQFGSALALSSHTLLVGAPRHENAGAVFVFSHDMDTGEWTQETVLQPEDTTGIGFGTTVAFAEERIMVGAPGNAEVGGSVFVYSRNDDGELTGEGSIVPENGAPGDRFGSAIAATRSELWIGAPGANEGSGTVHRFIRDHEAGMLRPEPAVAVAGTGDGFGLGSSIALSRDVAVVGAPNADGRVGRAAVFVRTADGGWDEGSWISPGGELDIITGGEVRCTDGQASGFDCGNVDLQAFLPVSEIGGDVTESVSDLWGWTDPESGREYALVGRSGGAAFVDVTDPSMPVYLGAVEANRSGARDLKVYNDHLFFTGDGAGEHGLVVFDLTRLRDVENAPVSFEPDAVYDGIASAHNLIIDTDAGFAYPVGASGGGETCGGGLHMVDIRDPVNPTFAGCYTDTEGLIYAGRTHDGQCVVYDGPDENFSGRQICFASNETVLRIVDVTDKENPQPIAAISYPGRAYIHQGWLTDDHRYFYLDDELDELVGNTDQTRTLILDLEDLTDPVVAGEYFASSAATDHNLYVKGDRMYQANYRAGLRVVDISDRENPVEIGYFDTTPYDNNPPGFAGAWTAYPFFESGTVIVSSRNEGLFILKPRLPELVP